MKGVARLKGGKKTIILINIFMILKKHKRKSFGSMFTIKKVHPKIVKNRYGICLVWKREYVFINKNKKNTKNKFNISQYAKCYMQGTKFET